MLASICACQPPPPGGGEGAEPGSKEPDESRCIRSQDPPKEIRFGVTPYLGTVVEEEFGPIAQYLEKEIGIPVVLVGCNSYTDLLRKVEQGAVDLASLAPLSYVRARNRNPCLQLLATQVVDGATYYSGYIVVRSDSAYETIEDLKGQNFAFVSRGSASGYLYPSSHLTQRGIIPEQYFSKVLYAGDHVRALQLLASGHVAAVATYSGVFLAARNVDPDLGDVRVLAITGHIPFDAICASDVLSQPMTEKIRAAMLALNFTTAEHRRILGSRLGLSGWIPTLDSVYDGLRELLPAVQGGDE